MDAKPERPEYGKLIEGRRNSIRPKLSIRKAAAAAEMSETRWRQIVRGYQQIGEQLVPTTAPAETLARMAEVVGATPEELRQAGRADAGDELRDRLHRRSSDRRDAIRAGTFYVEQMRSTLSLDPDERSADPPLNRLYEMRDALDEIIRALLVNPDARAVPDVEFIGRESEELYDELTEDQFQKPTSLRTVLDPMPTSGDAADELKSVAAHDPGVPIEVEQEATEREP